jgi:hypothetical protein
LDGQRRGHHEVTNAGVEWLKFEMLFSGVQGGVSTGQERFLGDGRSY